MRKLILLVVGVVLIWGVAGYLYVSQLYVFQAPFAGVASLGGGGAADRCDRASEQLDTLTATNGYLVGRLTDAVYWGNRLFVRLETLAGERYSLMIIPRELGDALVRDDYSLGFELFRLKYFYLSFCGRPNMFSTGLVADEKRLDSKYQQFRERIERQKKSGIVVAALVARDRRNLVFDRSGAIFVHQLYFYDSKP
ncbi:hypothetical protein HYU90_01335 [Candidatus Collierbacteria bacterium]|nr:hypothetical protein [Candidatus Collierbacteria bacterium]